MFPELFFIHHVPYTIQIPTQKMKYLLSLLLLACISVSMQAQHLTSGEKAPKIKTKDVFGDRVKLKKVLKDNKYVLVVFLRHAWCPVCNTRTHELIDNYKKIKEKGIEVLVVYQSTNKGLITYVKDYNLPYTVIADPTQEFYESYQLADNKMNALNSVKNNKHTKEMLKKGMKLYGKNKREKYKKEEDEEKFYMPGDFIINQKGEILLPYYGEYLGDHLPIEDVLSFDGTQTAPTPKKEKKEESKKKKSTKQTNVRF